MTQTASEFYLPPSARGDDPLVEEKFRAIEDHIQSTRTYYSGTVLDGAKVAGDINNPAAGMDLAGGGMQSNNFVTGQAGWRIADNGNAEFFNGTFRGTVRQTAVSARASRLTDSDNIAAGSYSLSIPDLEYNLGGGITVGSNFMSPDRTGIYLAVGYGALNLNVNQMGAAAVLRYGSTVGSGGTALIGNTVTNQTLGSCGLGSCAPIRLTAGTKVWLLVTTNGSFNLLAASFLALHYLSEG
jgi:hypothetical protein